MPDTAPRGGETLTREELIERLANLVDDVERPHPMRVAIDGVDGAGKTTLANELVAPLEARGRPVVRASIDGFHRPRRDRYRRGADSPEGYYRDSFDYDRLQSLLLEPLGPGGTRRYRRAGFDYRTDTAVEVDQAIAPPRSVLLFDGVFLQCRALAGCWDLVVFVDVSFEVSVERACRRDSAGAAGADAAAIRDRYRRRYVPGQRLYLAECSPRERAAAIVYNDDPGRPGLEIRGG